MRRLAILLFCAVAALPASAGEGPPSEEQAIAAVKQKLKDPDSAKFKNLRPMGEGGGYCGWVNARNSYGGYAGFAVFYVNSKGEVAILPPELSEPDLCG